MIKRTLGLWNDPGDEDEEGLTEAQQAKLERRLLPGGLANGTRGKFRMATYGEDSEPEDSDENPEMEGEESEDEPAMPPEEVKQIRGQFQCQLCPGKILMNEKIMEQHLQSEAHLKNARKFERAKAMGLEAFEDECHANAEARETAAAKASRRGLKKAQFWEKRRAKAAERKGGTRKAPNLSESQIQERKERFTLKKARRLEKKGIAPPERATEKVAGKAGKAASGGDGKKGSATADPSGLNRKQRRALAAEESAGAAAAKGALPTAARPPGEAKASKAEAPAAGTRAKRRKNAAA